jgi:glycosyltransferase involved in cell wall biosynthesis
MATYNGAAFLREQLQSFVGQTRRPDELVVSDDGSTDATREILEAFRAHAPFDVILRFNDRNLGYAGNFARALAMATGDLIFLSDQDDVWFPQKIEVMSAAAEATDALVLMNDALISDEGLGESGITAIGQIRAAGLPDSDFVMGCCAAVRADLLRLILPVDRGYPAHDSWIVRIAEGMGRKHIHEQALQYYRRHGTNASDFFVSRTKPVTRLSRIVDKVRRSRRIGARAELEQLLRHQQVLLRGVRRALVRSGGREAEDLERYRRLLETRILHIEERIAMRTLPRVYRLPKIVRLATGGGYAYGRGFQSIARDMFLK